MSWISLLTDYGYDDAFVAICHGVIGRLAPDVRILDITHAVPPGNVRRGATLLAEAIPFLPDGVHVGIVDPGVGTARRPIVVETPQHLFVGPDNGLLLPAAEAAGGIRRAFHLTNSALWLHPVSATFHGRDIFAPTAAHLATGTPVDLVGPELDPQQLVRLPSPVARLHGEMVEAEISSIDRFGNVQLVCGDIAGWALGQPLVVEGGGAQVPAVRATTFGAVAPGETLVYVDSAGRLAVAVHGGRADARLSVHEGDLLRIRPA